MLYLKNISQQQNLFIPRDGSKVTGELVLKVCSTIDKTMTSINVTDIEFSDLYFNVAVSLPEYMPLGEYEYGLYDGPTILSSGLLIVLGEENKTEYQTSVTYEQYTAE